MYVCTYLLDVVLKEHVAALPDRRRLAHQRVSRHSTSSARKRHKRPAPITKAPLVTSHYKGVQSRPGDVTPIISNVTGTGQPSGPNTSERIGKFRYSTYYFVSLLSV